METIYNQNKYNRNKAVQYALQYALKPNPEFRYFDIHANGGGDCSNFVSQCLLAGNAPMALSGANPWWYKSGNTNNKKDDIWSFSWSIAGSLYYCLKERKLKNLPGLQSTETDILDNLEIGDVIHYENSKGIIYHSAIITGFSNNDLKEPLISQHTYDSLNISYIKSAARKMHFMKIFVK